MPARCEARAETASAMLSPCTLCPRKCRIRRLEGEVGPCRIGAVARVASYGPHHGEEPPLSGSRGSGAVFFSGCNLRCLYCQNHDISREAAGIPVSAEGLAAIALDLEARGCHNLNLVSPTHVMPQILEGLATARREGFDLPVVWNCGGFESVEALRLLDGVVDIYMPDFKYGDGARGAPPLGIRPYPARPARRCGRCTGRSATSSSTRTVSRGEACSSATSSSRAEGRGPEAVCVSSRTRCRPDTYVNLMDQYRPAGGDGSAFGLDRPPTPTELEQAAAAAGPRGNPPRHLPVASRVGRSRSSSTRSGPVFERPFLP